MYRRYIANPTRVAPPLPRDFPCSLLAIFERDPGIMEKVSEIVARRNAEREAVLQGAGTTPAADAVATQQKSILGRMMSRNSRA